MKCEECGNKCEYGNICYECCEHEIDADEGYHCLNCGYNGFEDYAAAAYDRAKDLSKYGE